MLLLPEQIAALEGRKRTNFKDFTQEEQLAKRRQYEANRSSRHFSVRVIQEVDVVLKAQTAAQNKTPNRIIQEALFLYHNMNPITIK